MWNSYKKTKEAYPFIGIISSHYRGEELRSFKIHVSSHFNQEGGMIYTYSKYNKTQKLEYMERLWGVNLTHLCNINRFIPLCREDYLKDDSLDREGFLQSVTKGLDQLDKNGSKKKQVHITVDSFWDSYMVGNIQNFYDRLYALWKETKTVFIFRYIVEELSEESMESIFNNHDFLLVDGVEDFEVYSTKELFLHSLNLFAKYNSINRTYEKEMIRVEYLKTLGELMEGTVHDINNLLLTIEGYSQLCMTVGSMVEAQEYLEIIHKTALDGKNIIDKIQNHIRGSNDSLKGIYKFNEIINSCIEMTKHKFKLSSANKGYMDLIVNLDSKGYVYANEYEIRQAVLNIIINGIDAMDGKGVLTIKTYDIEDQIVLEIKDTGEGMNEATKNKIFTPYFTTKGAKGTGLGLSIAKKAFDNHNAQVYLDSKICEGTKFTIFFPKIDKLQGVAETNSNDYNN